VIPCETPILRDRESAMDCNLGFVIKLERGNLLTYSDLFKAPILVLYIHERISLYCQDQKMAGFLLNKEMDTSLERYFRDLHIDPTTGALF